MTVFLSVGSNYKYFQAWRHLLAIGTKNDREKLRKFLIERYNGNQALLFSKGRGALSAGVKLATGGSGMVAVTSMTCYVVIEAIKEAGCEPLYVDIDEKTLQFDAQKLNSAVAGKDVRAVIIQNTLGIPVDIDKVLAVAKKHNLAIIEDLAHSVGGRYKDGREIGSVGDFTMLSFGRDKMIDTINGGALVMRTRDVKKIVEPPLDKVSIKQQLRDKIYPLMAWHARLLFRSGIGKYILGFAYKFGLAIRSADGGTNPGETLPSWQAKLALIQLEKIDENVLSRLNNQEKYTRDLSDFGVKASSNGVRFPLLVENRDEVIAKLKEQFIFVEDVWYEVPISPARLYGEVNFPEKDYPNATTTSRHVVNLPTHQLVKDEQIEKIIEIINGEARPWNL